LEQVEVEWSISSEEDDESDVSIDQYDEGSCNAVRAAVASAVDGDDPKWLLDSGSVYHITSNRKLLRHAKQLARGHRVTDASGRQRSITEKGMLGDVLETFVVPGFDASTHLLSVHQLAALGYISVFLEDEAMILHESDIPAGLFLQDVIEGKSECVWMRVPVKNDLYEIPHSTLEAALRARHRDQVVHA
jgi:hypothetical protein